LASLKYRLMTLLQKFIYIWLIFCLGGVGPLIYFDGSMPGHEPGEHPYHVSIFEEASHIHNPLPPQPEALVEQLGFELFSQLDPHFHLIIAAQTFTPGFSQFFTSGLSKDYVLTTAPLKIFNLPSLFRPVNALSVTGQSAFSAPPDKPPSVYPA
jgi:hypothetical protein